MEKTCTAYDKIIYKSRPVSAWRIQISGQSFVQGPMRSPAGFISSLGF